VEKRRPWPAHVPANKCLSLKEAEADLDATLVQLADVLDPIGVKHIVAEVTDIYAPERRVACTIDGASQLLAYDRLVFALGSCLAEPAIPGLEVHAFNVDTFEAATLKAHPRRRIKE
jgi:NADH:quinone reductase (non-electrogenic)